MFKFVLYKDGTDQEILRRTLLLARLILMVLWLLVFACFRRVSRAYVWSRLERTGTADVRLLMPKGVADELWKLYQSRAWYLAVVCASLMVAQNIDYMSGVLVTADMRTTSGCGKGPYWEPAVKAQGDGVKLDQFDQHLGEVAKAYDGKRIDNPWYVPNVFSSSSRWAPTLQDTPGFLLNCEYEEREAFMSVNVSLPDVRPQAFLGSMKDFARSSLGQELVADVPDDQLGVETTYPMTQRISDGSATIPVMLFHSLATWTGQTELGSPVVMVKMMAGALLFDEWVTFPPKDRKGVVREGNTLFRGHTCQIVEKGFQWPWRMHIISFFDRFIKQDKNACLGHYTRAMPYGILDDLEGLTNNDIFNDIHCLGGTTLPTTLLTMMTNFQEPLPTLITRKHTCVEVGPVSIIAFALPLLVILILGVLVITHRLPITQSALNQLPDGQLQWALHALQEVYTPTTQVIGPNTLKHPILVAKQHHGGIGLSSGSERLAAPPQFYAAAAGNRSWVYQSLEIIEAP
ncbi:hypothetical protein PhCBS80983_g05854 [Powellomyces hirtus]|uniref:Uncharacterized protein n=1 Tax=Powellomyces hirtus TaxID=109895 RepID=A0A507DT18_9FUNG|nr:hypothetical protein PhCBS80983_g05854 [Powellomyces hirtus]